MNKKVLVWAAVILVAYFVWHKMGYKLPTMSK